MPVHVRATGRERDPGQIRLRTRRATSDEAEKAVLRARVRGSVAGHLALGGPKGADGLAAWYRKDDFIDWTLTQKMLFHGMRSWHQK